MCAKFRGKTNRGVEDWLDGNEVLGKRAKHWRQDLVKKNANPETSKFIDPAAANARVVEVYQKVCRVEWLENPHINFLCHYRRAQLLMVNEAGERTRSPVAVGDLVEVEKTGTDQGLVRAIAHRKNSLRRPSSAGIEKVVQVIATNIDLSMLMLSFYDPKFNPGLCDRFLIRCQLDLVRPVILVNKEDLAPVGEERRVIDEYLDSLRQLEIPIISMRCKFEDIPECLHSILVGNVSVVSGHSGVGKTSFLRKFLNRDIGRVGEVSQFNSKGKHTTTNATFYRFGDASGSGAVIDTPGYRTLSLMGVAPEELAGYYPELSKCQIENCDHTDAEICGAREFVRRSTYCSILESLRRGDD